MEPPSSLRRAVLVTVLLAYAGFIGLGLINSLIGVAWPAIRSTFGLPIDALGAVLVCNTIGYMVASAASGQILARLNVGLMLAISCGIATVSLIGISSAP